MRASTLTLTLPLILIGLGAVTSCASRPDSPLRGASARDAGAGFRPRQTPDPEPTPEAAARAIHEGARAASFAARAQAARPAFERALAMRERALKAADASVPSAWRQALPAQPPWTQTLQAWRAPKGPLSLGTTSAGRLIDGQELALDGPHHAVVSRARGRQTRWGTASLVSLILEAGQQVATAHPGSVLAVGNLSLRGGGDIPWSVSHNSGRDADLAFYVVDTRDGARPVAPDLIAFDDQGWPRQAHLRHLRFDVERNWALARALLQSERGQLQYLFISEGLKALLLEHARQRAEPEALLQRAAQLLRQPTDSSPHDDHFHVRVACQAHERLAGCLERGPRWPWVDWHDSALLANARAMQQALGQASPAQRVEIWSYLQAIESTHGPHLALIAGLDDEDEAARQAAWRVIMGASTWTDADVALMMRRIERGRLRPEDQALAYAMLRKSLHPWVMDFARARLQDPSVPEAQRALAADALAHHMDEALVPFLLEQLGSQPGPVRAQLALILHRITNRAEPIDWRGASPAALARALERWQTWWQTHSGVGRRQWLSAGFAQAGVDPSVVWTTQGVEPLIGLLTHRDDHVRYNANKALRQLTGRWASLEASDAKKLAADWRGWWKKHRRRLILRQS